jgi:hypothetical protein
VLVRCAIVTVFTSTGYLQGEVQELGVAFLGESIAYGRERGVGPRLVTFPKLTIQKVHVPSPELGPLTCGQIEHLSCLTDSFEYFALRLHTWWLQ